MSARDCFLTGLTLGSIALILFIISLFLDGMFWTTLFVMGWIFLIIDIVFFFIGRRKGKKEGFL